MSEPKVALRKESVDRNILYGCIDPQTKKSLSARRAWIEMLFVRPPITAARVALRKESVDRNCYAADRPAKICGVALRKESVDRNAKGLDKVTDKLVALRKESVDRNAYVPPITVTQARSLSARRAWIEIVVLCLSCVLLLSLSARRAWIEIYTRLAITLKVTSRSPQGERG